MMSLNCTKKARRRLRLPEALQRTALPTNGLGDWTVNLVQFGRLQLVMATSERSLLTVLTPARELRNSLQPNLLAALRKLLLALNVPDDVANREIACMLPISYGRATNRRVLGSMNDFAVQTEAYLERTDDLLTLALRLSDTPMSAIGGKSGYGYPGEVACQLLATAK
jgi:uncharacterized protein DUF6933